MSDSEESETLSRIKHYLKVLDDVSFPVYGLWSLLPVRPKSLASFYVIYYLTFPSRISLLARKA